MKIAITKRYHFHNPFAILLFLIGGIGGGFGILQGTVGNSSASERTSESLKLPSEADWNGIVIRARLGEKTFEDVNGKFPEICQNVFWEKAQHFKERLGKSISTERWNDFEKEFDAYDAYIEYLKARSLDPSKYLAKYTSTKKLNDFQQTVDAYVEYLSYAAQIFENDEHFDARMKIICMDILINDLIGMLEYKFDSDKSNVRQPQSPQIVKLPSGNFELRQDPVIEYISLDGGGEKGLVYPGMLVELAKAGKLDHLKAVAGCSVGAIVASAIGCGIPYEQLGDFCVEIRNSLSKEESIKTLDHYPSLKGIFLDSETENKAAEIAAGMIRAIDEKMTESVRAFLTQNEVNKFISSQENVPNENRVLDSREITRLKQLRNAPIPNEDTIKAYASRGEHFQRDEKDMLTFCDLEILRKIQIEGIPNSFKSLILAGMSVSEMDMIGWNESTYAAEGKVVYFCAQRPKDNDDDGFMITPHMPIAHAVRISTALPGSFEAIKINLEKYKDNQAANQDKLPNGVSCCFVDGGSGGLTSPHEAFIRPLSSSSSEAEKIRHLMAKFRVLVCVFDRDGEAFQAIQKDTNRNLVIGHGQLKTFNDPPLAPKVAAAIFMARLLVVSWCRQYKNEVAVIESSSLEVILKNLSIEELRNLQTKDDDNAIRQAIKAEIEKRKAKIEEI